ncbi:recombinase family protein [Pseudomonas anguilliseptica]|uniref:Site-specific DNA recombinase n=1 Tax=Pseudomonas anguilliseptica TaxID=53406 RepID=A0A1H4Q2K0_PSEAG|nr:recombinase family protein [Pseudomonas anguilliseptica]SEC13831.1 Site-specific DNA recombinase [Pseudomonas anguilliseptica]
MKAHLYLRASTKDQDSLRALSTLQAFAAKTGLEVAGVYAENVSGTKLDRPELFRLLESAEQGDVLLCESVDRLSRLSQDDWESLKGTIKVKGLRLVVDDLPTSHQLVTDKGITGQVMMVINNMLIDLMATMARLDQEKRVERIRQGLENKRIADPEWKPTGKKKNTAKHNLVLSHLSNPTLTMDQVAKLSGVGVATVYRIKASQQV